MLLHAPSLVSKALLSVLEMPIILGASPRSTVLRDAFTPWVSRVASNINFANSLVEELGTRVFGLHTLQAKTSTSLYERMWASYHSFSTGSNLVEIWSAALETPSKNTLHILQAQPSGRSHRYTQNSRLTKHFLFSSKLQLATLCALVVYPAIAQLSRKSQTRSILL